MSGLVKTGKNASTVSMTDGAPNMILHTVRQTALKLAERSLKLSSENNGKIEAIEFLPVVEWVSSTRISFETTGFNFLGDPPSKGVSRPIEDGPIPDVAALLSETELKASPIPASTVEPLVWDEIDIDPVNTERKGPFRPVGLELYHPPAPPPRKIPEHAEPETKASEVMEARVETPEPEPVPELEMADRLPIPLPSFHKPPAPALHGIGEPLAAPAPRLELPYFTFLPLRLRMCAGDSPEAVNQAAVTPVNPPEQAQQPVEATPAPVEVKPEPAATVVVKVAAQPVTIEAYKRKGKRRHKHSGVRAAPVEEPVEEPAGLSDEIEAELAAQRTEEAVTDAPPDQPASTETPKTPVAAPRFGSLSEVESKPGKKETIGLGLDSSAVDSLPAPSNSMGMKIGLGVLALAAIGGVALWQYNSSSAGPESTAGTVAVSGVETFGAVVGEAGWSTDWATDAQGKRLRQLSFYRPTMQISDYRVEFEAEVEYKAVSWIVRASDTKNYYVLKLNRTGPGAYNLLRFPVVNNKQGAVVEKQLPFPTRIGMVFKVRTDVVGNRFRVNMQDKLVDEWTEKELPVGGFGVANEGVERGQVRTIQVWHLRSRTAK